MRKPGGTPTPSLRTTAPSRPVVRPPRPVTPQGPRLELGQPTLYPMPESGWVYACREGYELDLAEELVAFNKKIEPRLLAPGLLHTEGQPPRRDRRIELTFARQAFPCRVARSGNDIEDLADRLATAIKPLLGAKHPFVLQTFVPDSDEGNRLSQPAHKLHVALEKRLDADPALAERRAQDPRVAGGLVAHVCLVDTASALAGVMQAVETLSHKPGGRARMGVGHDAPSRAAMKLEEALDWLGVGPEPGDRCVDLGAAPGGWTWALSDRRAVVAAVDLGKLRPDIAARKNVAYVHASAFNFAPEEPIDWLFCDMAWRPLEVAALLAKWGRNRWARALVANFKLPMKRKADMILRLRDILETGGWKDIRTRHLYHDREEITLTAWQR